LKDPNMIQKQTEELRPLAPIVSDIRRVLGL